MALAAVVAKTKNARIGIIVSDGIVLNLPLWKSFPGCFVINRSDFDTLDSLEIDRITNQLLDGLETVDNIFELEYAGINIGDLVYDEILVTGSWQASVWDLNDKVRIVIRKAVRNIHIFDSILSKYNTKGLCVTHSIGVDKGGLFIRFAVSKGVESYIGGCGIGSLIRKYQELEEGRVPFPSEPPVEMMEELLTDKRYYEKLLDSSKRYLNFRHSGTDATDYDSTQAFSSDKYVFESKDEFCEYYSLPKSKPIIFVMLHAFNDFPHHFKENLFQDYYHWFFETLLNARHNKNVIWVFKQHPSWPRYPDDSNLAGIFSVIDDDHILYLPGSDQFNAKSIRYIGASVFTCMGTAALEFSCFGVPAYLGGENMFSRFPICSRLKSIEEYRSLVSNIGGEIPFPVLDEKTKNLACIVFYIIYRFCYGETPATRGFLPIKEMSNAQNMEADHATTVSLIIKYLNSNDAKMFLSRMERFVEDNQKYSILNKDIILNNLD